jgi:hypothetical protein
MRRIKIVGYVTREFAHAETLERAKRWLIELGFHASRIEVHTHGTFRLTVSVDSGQADEVERVLDAVAAGDPEGAPSFWDHTKHQHGDPKHAAPVIPPGSAPLPSETFNIGWRPLDPEREVTQTTTEIEKQKDFREGRD